MADDLFLPENSNIPDPITLQHLITFLVWEVGMWARTWAESEQCRLCPLNRRTTLPPQSILLPTVPGGTSILTVRV